jgi:CBS domain-containing protein
LQALCPKALEDIAAVSLDATVLDALLVMAEHDVGAVPVLSNDRVVGVFSERDFSRGAILDGKDAKTVSICDAMTKCEVFATPAQTMQQCLRLMTEKRLRHIPVVDGDTLVGMVFLDELLKAIVSHHERVFHELELDWSILFRQGLYSC